MGYRGGPVESGLVRNVRKIAVLRANGIGDYIFTIPALDALRAAYPEAEIVLLGLPWHASFLRERPGPVDRVEVIPPSRGVRVVAPNDPPSTSPELEPFFERMRAECFDLALQLHGGGENSNPFVRRLGAALTAGLRSRDASPLDRWIPYDYWQREVLRLLEVVSLVGARPVGLDPLLTVTSNDREEARQVLPPGVQRLVAIHPGSSDPRRRWPSWRFAEVAAELKRIAARVVLTGHDGEVELTRAVQAACPVALEDLTGRLSLGGLAGFFAQCDAVIANDSGPLHLARAVGTATVGLYWCGNVVNAGPMTQARHRSLLSWTLICPRCGRDIGANPPCRCPVSFMEGIRVADVLDASRDLLCEPG